MTIVKPGLIKQLIKGASDILRQWATSGYRREKLLQQYIWQDADSSNSLHWANLFLFGPSNQFNKSKYWTMTTTNEIRWKWMNKSSNSIPILVVQGGLDDDTLHLSNINISEKEFTAAWDYIPIRKYEKRVTKTVRFVPKTTVKEFLERQEAGELREIKF